MHGPAPSLPRYQAALFDCDGVLVDSEPITNAVLSEMLGDLGWRITPTECANVFGGKGVLAERVLIEARIGRPLPEDWIGCFRQRRNGELARRLEAIPEAFDTVARVHERYAGRIAVVSGAHRAKVELQLAKCGMLGYFEGRIFSGQECARSKPHPDVYLAAAAALQAAPRSCVVVEDTVTGVESAVAAGATVVGYSPGGPGHDPASALLASGAARVIGSLRELIAFI